MKVELIPVIELNFNNQIIESPNEYPYWEHQDIWFKYRNKLLNKAGFNEYIEPYIKGGPFYEPKSISNNNLEKIILEVSKSIDIDDNNCLFGGYVLKIDNKNVFFPQCCGDLSDIVYWDRIANKKNAYHEGHPSPRYKFRFNKVIFNFTVKDLDEQFEPKPPENILKIDLNELKKAVNEAKKELHKLHKRIFHINMELNLNIDDLENILITNNPNHEY